MADKKQAPVPNVARKMDAREQARLQAMIGNMKEQNALFFISEEKKEITIDEKTGGEVTDLKKTPALYINKCEGSTFDLTKQTAKILVEGNKDCTLSIGGRILTRTVEVWKCDNTTLNVGVNTGTLQLDMLKGITVKFKERAFFTSIVWNSVHDMTIEFEDAPQDNFKTGFAEMKKRFPDSSEDVDQFIIRVLDGKVTEERCIRLKNGFLSTEREALDWENRNDLAKSRYMDAFLKESGVHLKKDVSKAKAQKPNAICACGSGKKFKKCCQNKTQLTGVVGDVKVAK